MMTTQWTVKDANGDRLPHFTSASPLEVARKVVPTHYDAFRLHVSSSYRELFERVLKLILEREDWQIVRVKGTRRARRTKAMQPRHGHQRLAPDCSSPLVLGVDVTTAHWSVKDANGELLPRFTGTSRLEVARKVVPTHYDAFRLQVSSSYRELFEQVLKRILEHKDWQIVRVRGTRRTCRTKGVQSSGAHHGLATDCSMRCQ
jgi:hypothetical protein